MSNLDKLRAELKKDFWAGLQPKEVFFMTCEAIKKDIEEINENFRKDNIPQRLSGDEFNDLWVEEIKKLLEVKDE